MLKSYDILLVEDDLTHAMIIKQMLMRSKDFSYNVHHVTYLEGAINLLSKRTFDITLLDLNLPDSKGIQTIEKMLLVNHQIPILSITALEDTGEISAYLKCSIQDYLPKKALLDNKLDARIQFAIQRKQNQVALGSPLNTKDDSAQPSKITLPTTLPQQTATKSQTTWIRV